MSRLSKEWEIKLSLMGSVARSQRALAKMLESAADVATGGSGVHPSVLMEHVRALTGMQGALLRTVTGIGWRPPRRGVPEPPWLAEDVRVATFSREE